MAQEPSYSILINALPNSLNYQVSSSFLLYFLNTMSLKSISSLFLQLPWFGNLGYSYLNCNSFLVIMFFSFPHYVSSTILFKATWETIGKSNNKDQGITTSRWIALYSLQNASTHGCYLCLSLPKDNLSPNLILMLKSTPSQVFHKKFCYTNYIMIFIGFLQFCKTVERGHTE